MNAFASAARPPALLKLLAHDVRWQILTALAQSDRRVQELVRLGGQPQNLVSYHLGRLRAARLVIGRRSSADSRDIYYSIDLIRLRALYAESAAAIHPALSATKVLPQAQAHALNAKPARVLFLCTHNSARSQLAEALARHLGGSRIAVFSAGSEPSFVHPDALRLLSDMHIETSGLRSKHLDEYSGQKFDYIITVCDRVRETCPVFPGDPQQIHWSFADPVAIQDTNARSRAFIVLANELKIRIEQLLVLIDRERNNP